MGSGEPEADRDVEGSANSVDFHTTASAITSTTTATANPTTSHRSSQGFESNAVENEFDEKSNEKKIFFFFLSFCFIDTCFSLH